MCKYCGKGHIVCNPFGNDYTVGLKVDKQLIAGYERYYLVIDGRVGDDCFKQGCRINYCPWCGRKLSDD